MTERTTADPGAFLRGALPHVPAGAAGLYSAAELHGCPAHALMTMAQVSPADVAAVALRQHVPQGQSPLALGRGTAFERQLTRDTPSRLQTALDRNGLGTDRFVDVASTVPMPPAGHGRSHALAARETATLAAVGENRPVAIWQGALTLLVGKTTFRIQPDLIVRDREGIVRVGEVKSWADNGPRTSPRALSSALGQVAVGERALRQAGQHPVSEAVLVLASPRSSDPSVRVQPTDREATLVDAAARSLPRAASLALASLPPGSTLDDPDAVRALPTSYSDLCWSRCALATWCRRRAVERGDPAVLGAAAASAHEPDRRLGDPAGRPRQVQAAVDAYLRAARHV